MCALCLFILFHKLCVFFQSLRVTYAVCSLNITGVGYTGGGAPQRLNWLEGRGLNLFGQWTLFCPTQRREEMLLRGGKDVQF